MTAPGRPLHFIAIGGAGMSGLALVCRALGHPVTGSDRVESAYLERLRAAGIEPIVGHDAAAVPAGADVVVSTAIPRRERRAAASSRTRAADHASRRAPRRGLRAQAPDRGRRCSRQDDDLGDDRSRAAGDRRAIPPSCSGGELPGAGPGGEPANAGWGESPWVVAEADESDGSFLELDPEVAVVTNVELDHHSHWSGEGELIDAFARFAARAAAVVRPAGPDSRPSTAPAPSSASRSPRRPGGRGPGVAAALLASDVERGRGRQPVPGRLRAAIGEIEVRLVGARPPQRRQRDRGDRRACSVPANSIRRCRRSRS